VEQAGAKEHASYLPGEAAFLRLGDFVCVLTRVRRHGDLAETARRSVGPVHAVRRIQYTSMGSS
jgi:hypothetical protein